MNSRRIIAIAFSVLVFAFGLPANAKIGTAKVQITGSDLSESIEITDMASLGNLDQVFGPAYVETDAEPIADVPDSPVAPYEIRFFGDYGERGIRENFVVYFAWDAERQSGRVYFPARGEPWYSLNASTIILREMEGRWFPAREMFSEAIYRAIEAR